MSNRFSVENAPIIVEYLRATGADKDAHIVKANTDVRFGNGTYSHSLSEEERRNLVSIKTKVSNTKLHKVACALGLIEDNDRKQLWVDAPYLFPW
jgi:hypothetical protein